MTKSINLNVSDNEGYSPAQVADRSITLADLLEAVEQAIATHGGETRIVIANGQRYGAGYGIISQWDDIFEEPEAGDDDEENLGYGD